MLRWPISMSALGVSRLRTHSTKFATCRAWPSPLTRALCLVPFLDPPAFVADDQRPFFAVEGDAEEFPSVPWFDQILCSYTSHAPGNPKSRSAYRAFPGRR